MKKTLLIIIVLVASLSGCIQPHEGLATITQVTLPASFSTGSLTEVLVSIKNDGLVPSTIYATLNNLDGNEVIQQLDSINEVEPEHECVLNFVFQLSQETSFNGRIYAGHEPESLDDQASFTISYVQNYENESYENFNTYLRLNDPDNHINLSSDGKTISIEALPQTSFALLKKAMNLSGNFILKYTYNITSLSPSTPPMLNGGWISMALSECGTLYSHSNAETIQGRPKNQTFVIYVRCYTGGTYYHTNITTFRDMRYDWSSQVRMDWNYATLQTEYDATITRVNGTISVQILQGENVVYSNFMENVTTQFMYFYPVLSLGGGTSTLNATGVFKNFQITRI
jgi:hypothetical protein